MRARKITIILAMIAVSALTMFILTLPSCAVAAELKPTLPAVPDTLSAYSETVIAGPDGDDRVEIVIVTDRGHDRNLLVPFDFDDGTDISILSGPATFGRDHHGVEQPTVVELGRRHLNLRCVGMAAGDTIRVSAAIPGWFEAASSTRPFGETQVARSFVNTSDLVIRGMNLALILPDGMLVHAVQKVRPEYDAKKSPEPPFVVRRVGSRDEVSLHCPLVDRAETLELLVNIRPARRGPLLMVLGIVAAVLYLIVFRDVLKPKSED